MLSDHYKPNSSGVFTSANFGRGIDYSDGSVEESEILATLRRCSDVSLYSPELMSRQKDWVTEYHFSSHRANLLHPLKDRLTGKVLEIGSGCGALSRFLGEVGCKLTSLEGSLLRATITRERCRDLSDVTVVAEDFFQFCPEELYDTVLCIGVLEYSPSFYRGEGDPVTAFLQKARTLLAPGGKLILAIENRMGLKYFAGYPEDHTGRLFSGITDSYAPGTVVTLGQQELKSRLSAAGFANSEFLFPFPDYKFPALVLSEDLANDRVLGSTSDMIAQTVLLDKQRSFDTFFNMEMVWRQAAANDLVGALANSFLVVSSEEPPSLGAQLHLFSLGRKTNFLKQAHLDLRGESPRLIRTALLQRDEGTWGLFFHWTLSDEPFCPGENWWNRLVVLVNKEGWSLDDLRPWLTAWWNAVQQEFPPENGFLPGTSFDMTPYNLMLRQGTGELVFIDQEWTLKEPVEIRYFLFRSLYLSLRKMSSFRRASEAVSPTYCGLVTQCLEMLGFLITYSDVRSFLEKEDRYQQILWGHSLYEYTDKAEFLEERLRFAEPAEWARDGRDDVHAPHASLFWGQAGRFSSERCLRVPLAVEPGSFSLRFDLPAELPAKDYRFDPFEGHWGSLVLDSIHGITGTGQRIEVSLASLGTNGQVLGDGSIRFESFDPMVFFSIPGSIRTLVVEGELRPLGFTQIEDAFRARERRVQDLSIAMGWYSTLFLDLGDGYRGQYERQTVSLDQREFVITYQLEKYSGLREVRFDPFEGHWGKVNVKRVEILGRDGHVVALDLRGVRTNGVGGEGGVVVFETTDPQYFLPLGFDCLRLTISGEWEFLDAAGVQKNLERSREESETWRQRRWVKIGKVLGFIHE